MADVQSNIQVSIDATQALASIKNLQRQISAFHSSMAKGGAAANAVSAQLQQTLINSINATGKFSAGIKTIKTTTESFTSSLEKNKFSLGEYFRYAGGASKTFGRLFKTEFDTINKVARENVKDLQTQYIRLGRDASGAMKSIAVRPLSLDMNDLATKTMIASEKQALLNQLLKQGSTNLLNFGKNTQWAGRQLMVGFTLPLIALGSAASKTFMDMETQAIRFKKVYGDLFTPTGESQQALKDIQELGKEFTKYGIAVSTTVGLAAEAAAAGFKGLDLQRQTAAATKLSILGQVESQKALETTISLQNAFAMSSENLAESIDFLNAVENQTVLSLDDISTAIPKAAPIVQQLGGDVKDLAFLMTAMKEGGINASEGANALKSGLASLINPTGKANDMLLSFGINAKKIVVDNKGDLKKTVIEFATALNQLDPLNRAQAIEQMFGKFQFSRLSTLFANVTKEGTQASRVLDLAGASIQELASLSEKELGMTSESAMNKFKGAVESLKVALVPLGEEFLKAATPIAEFITKIIEKFNNLSDNTKKIIVTITAVIAGLGPVFLMTFGLLANGIANIIKGFTFLKTLFNKTGQSTATLGTEVKYMTTEQRNAAAVAASLDQVHVKLAQTFTSEASAVNALTRAYQRAIAAQSQFVPVAPPLTRGPIKKFAGGKPVTVGGTGNKDSELALLMPGETVIPTAMSKKYGGIINAMIADRIPGYEFGKTKKVKSTGEKGKSTGKKVILPGGMDVSHFGSKKQISGEELIKLFEGAEKSVLDRVTRLVGKIQNGTTRMFTVFDNQVVALLSDVNRDLDKQGKVSVARLKENLLGKDFAPIRDIELQRQFDMSGKSVEDFKLANQQITEAIQRGFAKLGGKVDLTEAEVSELIETAYREVGEVNQDVKKAHEKMKTITTVTEPDVGGVRGKRVALTSESYVSNKKGTKKRPSYKTRVLGLLGKKKNPYNFNSEFNISPAALESLKLTGDQAADIFKRMSLEAQKGLAELKGNTEAFVKQFAIEAKKIGVDPYVASRDGRSSPHKLAPKDGKDDAKAYSTARDKELKRQSGRTRRVATRPQGSAAQEGKSDAVAYVEARDKELKRQSKKPRRIATRPQGPAPIGATPQSVATILPIVPLGSSNPAAPNNPPTNNKTILQRLGGAAKNVGGRMTGMGGGMGLLGLNMGLSMAPDFAGKGMLQGATTGANLGMFFGPKGMAAGAVIGGLTSALSSLNAKIKEYGETNRSAFTISNSLITAFGDKVLDTKIKVTELSKASIALRDKFGLLSPQVQAIIDDLKKLPEDNPLAIFVKSISKTDQSLSEVTGNIRSKLTTDISIGGLDPKNAQKYVYILMVAAGKANEFGAVWKSISKDVVDVSAATEASFNKVGDAVNKAGGSFAFLEGRTGDLAKDYDELRPSAKTLSDQMFSFFGVLSNGAFTFNQIQERLQAFSRSSVDAKTGILALQAAIKASGDDILIERFALIERIIKESGKAATATAADYTMMHLALEMLAADGKNLDDLRTDLFPDERERALARRYATDAMLLDSLMKGKDFKEYINKLAEQRKALDDALNGNDDYKDYGDGVDGLSASSKAYLDILEKEIKGLEEKRDAQQSANDETQRQIDLQQELADLAKQSVLAKISGDYIGAASLQQQAQNVQMEFDQETELRKKDAEIDRLRARAEAIRDGAKLTKEESAKVSKATKPKKKAASGGMIRGAGTATSDSIPALLSNGEYVVKAKSVKKYGVGTLDELNAGRFANGGLVPGFKDGGSAKDGFMQKWSKSISGSPLAEMLGTAHLLRLISGQGKKGDNLGAAKIPLSLLGSGLGSKIMGNLGKSAFYLPNKINQMLNQRKVNSMIKSGVFHGSQPVGHRGEEYLQGTNILDGSMSTDPHYGMGFFGTTSKSEARLYASGYNSPNNWGESFGSMNQIISAPRGKYVDFTRGPKSLKWQDYGLSKAIGKSMPENLGDLMNAQGLTGGIMNRVSSGRAPEDIMYAKWLAFSNAAGVMTKELGYKDGGLASRPKYGKKQNAFQRYVANLTKAHDESPIGGDPLGVVAMLRKFAGQGRKGDSLSAALMPLNFMGIGLGKTAPALSASKIEKLTSKWTKPSPYSPATEKYDWTNTDPLHGPLFIGKADIGSEGVRRSLSYSIPSKRGGKQLVGISPQFSNDPRYLIERYMAGDKAVLARMQYEAKNRLNSHPLSIQSLFKSVATPYRGKLYRGMTSQSVADTLPKHIVEAIQKARETGDFSALLGKDFIMRRASFSSDKGIASFFAPGYGSGPYSSLLLEASLFGRKVTPTSKMFPDKKFMAPYGQKSAQRYRSELESLVGGKFIITGFDGKTLKVDQKAKGGLVKKYAMGGLIKGPGTGKSDSIRATLGYAGGGSIRVSNGEYVVNASSVKDYGVKTMDAINNGSATVSTNSGSTVYNINMPVTSNNANAEGVANEVIRKLKLEVSKNNKSNKVGL